MASVFLVFAYDFAASNALPAAAVAAFVQFKTTEEPNVTFPAASQLMFPPATAPAPVASSFHLNPRIPFEPMVTAPEAPVYAPAVLLLVPRYMLSASMLQPPIFPRTTFSVNASMLPAVISDVFNAATLIRAASMVPIVIWEALMRTAFTVLAESVPVKMPVESM